MLKLRIEVLLVIFLVEKIKLTYHIEHQSRDFRRQTRIAIYKYLT